MHIWVDADACPRVIRDILLRAAERVGVDLVMVANQSLALPPSPRVRQLRVPGGFDAADARIVAEVAVGDLVVTADIPLAAAVVARGALALDPRGELYTEDNVRERLDMRDAMDQLRSAGVETGGPAALSLADRATFANRLDALLARRRKEQEPR